MCYLYKLAVVQLELFDITQGDLRRSQPEFKVFVNQLIFCVADPLYRL